MLGGIVITVQGFETVRYLGEEFDGRTRIWASRVAQPIASSIYIGFVAVATLLMGLGTEVGVDGTLLDITNRVLSVLALPLVLSAVLGQVSAATAETVAAGSNLNGLFGRTMTKSNASRATAIVPTAMNHVVTKRRRGKHREYVTHLLRRSYREGGKVKAEAALDGIYVQATSVAVGVLGGGEVVRSYKQLAKVERAFRTLKDPLEVRPIHHRLKGRVRTHVFLCMLAYYLEWHLREAWAELTFRDEEPPVRPDPIAKAARSEAAAGKAASKRTRHGEPTHSFESLLSELSSLTRNTIKVPGTAASFEKLTRPAPLQARALKLAESA